LSNFNQAAVLSLFAALKSQAEESGLFRRVLGHEPRSAPGNGLTYALWLGPAIEPVARASGLNITTGRIVFYGRIYVPFLEKSEDQIETDMLRAVLQMIGFYSGALTIGGTVMEIDLLGSYGTPLECGTVGYLDLGGSYYRVADFTIPVIITDLWPQAD
jgi:hypothetical protein